MDSRPYVCKHEERGPEKVSMAKWIKGHCLHFKQVPTLSSFVEWLDNYRMIPIIKPTRCTNFSNLFWNITLHVSDSFSVHHQESSTVYTTTGICHTGYADCLLAGSG